MHASVHVSGASVHACIETTPSMHQCMHRCR
jgi:wyosine [tRNA(Phe)-imidazoG37] synthetase (radical SAM superfamily)